MQGFAVVVVGAGHADCEAAVAAARAIAGVWGHRAPATAVE